MSPASVAGRSRAICRYWGRKARAPNMSRPVTKASPAERANTGLVNSSDGMNASAAPRWRAANTTARAPASASSTATGATTPGAVAGHPGERQHAGADRPHQQHAAPPVEVAGSGGPAGRQASGHHRHADGSGRDADGERPPPPRARHEESAHHRPDQGGKGEHAHVEPLEPAPLAGRNQVGHGADDGGGDAAGPGALQAPGSRSGAHMPGAAVQATVPGQEEGEGHLEHDLAAVDVARLAEDRAWPRSRRAGRR